MWRNVQDPVLILLIAAAMISTILGVSIKEERENMDWVDGVAIWAAVIVVTAVGSWTDYSKELQFHKLNKIRDVLHVNVKRSGSMHVVLSTEVVVGDVVFLDTGDRVPADGVLVTCADLKIDESSLSGESEPVWKKPWSKDVSKCDPWLKCGTQVSEGSGYFLVTGVGSRSEWGKLIESLSEVEEEDTLLQKKLANVANIIGRVGMIVALTCFITLLVTWIMKNRGFVWSQVNDHGPVQFLLYSITIIVVAVPEGLPLAVTLALAYSMSKMMRDNNFVRVLASCETMGGVTTICSDKTGTLTENRMTVVEGWIAGNRLMAAPEASDMKMEVMEQLVQNITLTSKAFLVEGDSGRLELVGNRTECALLMMVRNWGMNIQALRDKFESDIVKLFGFSSDRKTSSVVVRMPDQYRLHIKGAPEWLLARCSHVLTENGTAIPITDEQRTHLDSIIANIAKRGLRCICLAYYDMPIAASPEVIDATEATCNELVFSAIFGIKDPVRAEVPEAVRVCKKAGITVRMVTGDNMHTATHIATECGIYNAADGDIVMEGHYFRKIANTSDIQDVLPRLRVLARSSPQDKLTLVKLLQASGEVVAVTGDGTNDAPALRQSDVGLAMGITGTEVAKNAADIIILDDNFSSIVKSVLWGRSVFNSIRKFLLFQLTINGSGLVLAFVGAVVGGHQPLSIMELLWVNLIQDTMAALALATEEPDPELLDEPPYAHDTPLITRNMVVHIIVQSAYQIFWVFTLLYYLPGSMERYHVSSPEEYYAGHCVTDLVDKYELANATASTYCDIMQHCGFPLGAATANTTDCPLQTEFGTAGVPTEWREALCGGVDESCERYEFIWDAHLYLSANVHEQQEVDLVRPRSVLFNAFIMMQIANEFCARRIHNEYDIFSGVLRSPIFCVIIVLMIGIQVLLMQTPGIGMIFKVEPLDQWEWLATIVIGLGVFIVSYITRFLCRTVPLNWRSSKRTREGWVELRVNHDGVGV